MAAIGAIAGAAVQSVLGIIGKAREQAGELKDKLARRGADWLVALIFALWAVPMVHGYADPDGAAAAVAALERLPEWYRETFIWMSIFAMGYPMVPKVRK